MPNTPVPLPLLNAQTLFALECPDCERLHCFRQLHHHQDDHEYHYIQGRRYPTGSHVLYNHPADFGPWPSRSDCPTCPALENDDPAAVQSAYIHSTSLPGLEGKILFLDQFALVELGNRVIACPQCGETTLFNTDWKNQTTQFWCFGMDRITRAVIEDRDKWKRLMAGDPDCTFCNRLQANEADAIAEAEAYTEENFPDLNDDPPLL